MKKILCFLLLLLLSVSLIACKKSAEVAPTDSVPADDASTGCITEEDALYLIREQYDDSALENGGRYEFTFMKKQEIAGKEYLSFSFRVVNADGEPVSDGPDLLVAADGSYVVSADALTDPEEETPIEVLPTEELGGGEAEETDPSNEEEAVLEAPSEEPFPEAAEEHPEP